MAAEGFNAEGNKFYLAGDKKGALEKYSQAIGVDAKVAKYFSNRAQVFLDLQKFHRAASDADKAIELDPSAAKHCFRSAKAYFALDDYQTALARGQAIMKLDPSRADGAQIIALCEKALADRVDPSSPQGIRLAGARFLQEKDTERGVYRLPSGLRFSILKKPENESAARSPKENDQCVVHYHGSLIDGTVFDSSVERNDPASFAPSDVIPGWTEALQYMCEGEKWRVFLPYNLAYGAQGAGDDIPGFSTLVFTIELIKLASASGGKPAADGHAALIKQLGTSYSELLVVD